MGIVTLLNFHTKLPDQGSFSSSELDPGTQHHIKVLRVKTGEEITFLDGRGGIRHTRCSQIRPIVFDIVTVQRRPPLMPKIELCLAAPKGDLLWESITQATEVGATSIRLLRTNFTQYPKAAEAPISRAQKISDAACEQCNRAWRVEIHQGWQTLEECLKLSGTKVFADERLSDGGVYGVQKVPAISEGIRLFVGPEGGWSESEHKSFDGVATALGLGPLILRVPTAAATAIHYLKALYS